MLFLRLWRLRSICDRKHRLQLSRPLWMIRCYVACCQKKNPKKLKKKQKKHIIVKSGKGWVIRNIWTITTVCSSAFSVWHQDLLKVALFLKKKTHKKVCLPPTQTVSCGETLNTSPEREAERILSNAAERPSWDLWRNWPIRCDLIDRWPIRGLHSFYTVFVLLSVCTKPSKVCVYRPVLPVWWANAACTRFHFKPVSSLNQYKMMVSTTVQTTMATLLTILIPVLRIQLQAIKHQFGTWNHLNWWLGQREPLVGKW